MYHVILLVPAWSMLKATVQVWLVPFLLLELLPPAGAGRGKTGSCGRRLWNWDRCKAAAGTCPHAAQRAAAVDDLTA